MDIMSSSDWLRLTNAGALSVRSSELKAVDAALARYHRTKSPADRDALTAALLRWIQSKGAGWKSSVRNRHQAVETLHAQLMGTAGRTLKGVERVALSHVRDESRAIVADLFRGKRLIWRAEFRQKLAQQKLGTTMGVYGLVSGVDALTGKVVSGGVAQAPALARGGLQSGARGAVALVPARGASGGTSAMALAQDLLRNVVPADILPDVTFELTSLLPDFMTDLAAAMTPFVGLIKTGGGTLYSGFKLARGQYRLDMAREHVTLSLATAEPAAALEALTRMLERERNEEALGVAVGVAEFGGKLAGVLADGGTATNAAIGLAASVARLTNIVRLIVRDVQERNAGNRAMQAQVDATIFRTCPVVGAYLVCCAPTSVLVNTIFASRFGTTGWQGEVEHTVLNHLMPLREQAARLVRDHRFVIPELVNFPGLVERNEKKLAEMMERKGKTGMVGFGSADFEALPPTRARR